MYLLALIVFFIVFNYFSGDFQKIKDKINYENELELGKLNYDYESNKCDVNGNLPAIAEKCKILSRKIKLFEKVKKTFKNKIFNSFRTQFQTYQYCLLCLRIRLIMYIRILTLNCL